MYYSCIVKFQKQYEEVEKVNGIYKTAQRRMQK